MKKIFIGLIFLFFNFHIQTINILPEFVGYILIFLGLDEGYECPSLNASRTIAVASAVIMAVVWGAAIFGYGMKFPIGSILQMLNTYRLVVWAREQAEEQGWDSALVQRFRVIWYALAGTVIAAYVLGLVNPMMALVWLIAAFVVIILYIVTYYQLWKSAAPDGGK